MGYPVDGWIEGPGLPQSVWRYKWLVGGLVLLGILSGSLFSASQPTRYEGVVRIFVTRGGGQRTVPRTDRDEPRPVHRIADRVGSGHRPYWESAHS